MLLTPRIVAYLGSEEGLVPEMYFDSVGVATWAMGITARAGVDVMAYKDNPAPLDECLRASIDNMRDHYLPQVALAFAGQVLDEAQIAAALSFHWNTGAIRTATWVADWMAGRPTSARVHIMSWTSHGLLKDRRERERDLFFDGVWPPLKVPVYSVSRPAYHAVRPVPVDMLPALKRIMT